MLYLVRSVEKFCNDAGQNQEFRCFIVAKDENTARQKGVFKMEEEMVEAFEYSKQTLQEMDKAEREDVFGSFEESTGFKALYMAITGSVKVEQIEDDCSTAFISEPY